MSDLLRRVRRVVGASEIPVPEGHARRHKGMTHVFAKEKDALALFNRLQAAFGTPIPGQDMSLPLGATTRFATDQNGGRLWLTMPHEGHPFATVSFSKDLMPTKDQPIVTESRVLDVLVRLKRVHDGTTVATASLVQDARECLAYLHGSVLRHGPGFVVQVLGDDQMAPTAATPAPSGVDAMSDEAVRALLKELVDDVRAGYREGSSEEIGDMVLETLGKAGIPPEDPDLPLEDT